VALISDLVCIQVELPAMRFLTKPALVIFLAGYFFSSLWDNQSLLKWWVAAALGFSWLGDVFLLFESQSSLFFIMGLSSFLLAHVCYSWFFNKVHKGEYATWSPWFTGFVVIYYAALMRLLSSGLGTMKVPVYFYGIVICIMFWLALHLNKIYQRNAGLYLLLGASLFVLSDSILAINKFYQPITGAGLLIMSTYGLAQWLITEGAIQWFQVRSVEPFVRVKTVRDATLV